jgi:peroxiredoxin
MALLNSEPIEMGTRAPDFSLPDIDETLVTLDTFAGARALVVMFICNHCPYVKAIEDRLIDLGRELTPRGVAFVGIMPNDVQRYPDDSPERMREHAIEKDYPFAYLYDETQATARAYGAVCTPDLFVFDSTLGLAYHGRLDDNWKNPSEVTRRELRAAILQIADGKPAPPEQLPAMGCSIKWKT